MVRTPLNPEALAMRELARIFANPERYERAQKLARRGQKVFVRGGVINRLPGIFAGWTTARDLTPPPSQSFRDWWRTSHEQQKGDDG